MTFNEARKAAGLTQQQMAIEMECGFSSVQRYCSGANMEPAFMRRARDVFAKHGVEWGPEVCPCCGRAL
ncbi:MAG: helix-turn-helix transcriptional regulator [Bryobacteraceae bacterium]